MKTNRKVLLLLLVMVLALVSVLTVGCKSKDPAPTKTEWPEAGVYYYDAGNDEYTLTLNVGDTFALIVKGQSNSGSYTLNSDGNMTLDFSAEGKNDATARLENDVITLTLDNATMRFLKKVNYNVNYETNGGSTVADETVVNGKTLAKPADPTKDGYVFVGWYADNAFKTPFAFGLQPITADTTVYAQWAAKSDNDTEYTVTLDANYDGAEALAPLTTKGGKVYDLPTLSRDGYTFNGWWISMDTDGEKLSYQYKDGMVLDANTTLYALWQQSVSGNKLSAPVVNVEAGSVSWTNVSGARSYNVKVVNSEGVTLVDTDTSATTLNVPFANYEAGEYKITVTALALAEENNAESTRFYTNKALGRVSLFNVYNQTLVFNSVPGAEKYYVSVVCGNPNHKHTLVDNGSSTTYSFANCDMPADGIKFTVTATAEGFASSTSEVFVHKMLLGAVEGLTYNAETQTVTWKPVADASYYMVQVSCGNDAHTHSYVNNGVSTSVDLKECAPVDGKVTVKVYPVTKGFASPEAATIECAKTALATPDGIAINGTTVAWNTVDGATGYEIKIGGKTYEAENNSFDLSALVDYVEGTEYTVSIRALGTEASMWTETVSAYYYELNEKVTYANSTITWSPVIGASRYEIQVNNGEIITVDNGAYTATVSLNRAGVNVVKVRFVAGNHVSDWATTEVFAYAVTLDTRGGSDLGVQYKAIGDAMNLPSPEKTGYSFVQWCNAPGSNALAYTDTLFAENGAIVLYAHYNANKYTVEYNYGDGGSDSKTTDEVLFDSSYQLVAPTPNSVTSAFAGWFSEPNGAGTRYTDARGNSVANWSELEGKTLYAFWVDPTLTFTQTKVNGKDGYMVSAGDRIVIVDEITVPATYMDLPVLMVAGNAFKNCTNLKTVNLPSTIEAISVVDPFDGCINLEAINVYNVEGTTTVRYWSEDGVLFYNGENGTSPASVAIVPTAKTGSYRIPDGIVELGAEAFKGASISRVVIPASVTRINDSAFEGCANLTSVVFEVSSNEQALTIGARAFANCGKLERIILPARLTEINLTRYTVNEAAVSTVGVSNAFDGCTSLSNIIVATGSKSFKAVDGVLYSADGKTLLYCPTVKSGEFEVPTGVQIVAPGAFIGCNAITSVTLPNTLTYVGECAFYGLSQNLTAVTFKGANLGTGVTVGKYAFRDCAQLSTLNLETGSRLVALSEGAFYNCYALPSFTVPTSMTSIGKQAFYNCYGMKELSFAPNGETLTFGEDAFYGCNGFTRIELPAYISEVPAFFANCSALTEIEVSSDSTYFASEDGVLFTKDMTEIVFFPKGKTGAYTLPETVTKIGNGIFKDVQGLTSIKLPNTLEVIGDEAFKNFRINQSYDGETVNEFVFYGDENTTADLVIGKNAFESCYIPSLALPTHTKSLGEYSFYNASFYKYNAGPSTAGIILNEGLEVIEAYAFYATYSAYESSYATLNIPASVKSIGDFCFYNGRLFPIFNEGLESIGAHAFYQWSAGYSKFTLNLPASLTTIGDGAFRGIYYLEKIVFAADSKLESIGAYAFASCSSLTSFDVPNTVTRVGAYAFKGCSNLTTVTFAEGGSEDLVLGAASYIQERDYSGNMSTTLVSGHVFDGCNRISTVSFPSRLTDMGTHTFYNTCSGYCTYDSYSALTVTFGENSRLETIGEYAFYNSHLHSIEIPKSVVNQAPVINDEFGQSYDRLAIGAKAFGRDLSNSYCNYIGLPGGITFEAGREGEITIGESAFYKTFFTSIELPAELAPYTSYTGDIIPGLANGQNVFEGMTNLEVVDVLPGNYYAGKDGVVYNATFTELLFCPSGKAGAVTIPATITNIPAKAFYGCNKITAITIEDGTANLTIGDEAFYGCTLIEELVLPKRVVSLGDKALAGCSALKLLTLSKNLESFDFAMIDGCNALSSIIVPEGTTAVYSDKGVIYTSDKTTLIYCPAGLSFENKTYTVLDGTKVIASGAFKNNSALEYVILPDGLTEIRDSAFESATALLSIEIPNTVELIGNNAFQYCGKAAITFEKGGTADLVIGNYAFGHTHFTEMVLSDRVITLGDYVFENSTDLSTLSFGDNPRLTTIGSYVFINTAKLTEVTFPDTLVTMGSYNFASSSAINAGIQRVNLGNGLKTLGESNFENLQSLKYVYIGSSLETMGKSNFRLCSNLTTVEFAKDTKLTKLPMGTFHQTGITSIEIPASVVEIERKDSNYYSYGVFENCLSLEEVKFAEGSKCTLIGDKAFYNCTKLTKIDIPASVIELGNQAFMYCTGFTTFTVPMTVTKLGTELFKNCTGLTDIVLNTVTTALPANMLEGCTGLTELKIPDYVTSIGTNCFANSGITSFIIPEDHKTLTYVGGIVYTKDMTALVLCPPGVSFSSITIPKEVTTISEGAFRGMTQLKTVIFEEGGTAPLTIGNSAFYGCSNLTMLAFPDRLTTIGEDAFYDCTNLMYVELSENLTSIGTYAFYQCQKLLEVYNKSSMSESDLKQWGYPGYYAQNIFTPTSGKSKITVHANGFVTIYLEDVYVYWNIDNLTGDFLLGYIGDEKNIAIPDGVVALYTNALYKSGPYDSIVIPDGIAYVMSNALTQCGAPLLLFKGSEIPTAWGSYWNSDGCQTILGWNGSDNTYSFVTEYGGPIESITSKYAISLPVLENQGELFFVGWYDNAEYNGSPLSGSYYSAEKTTLYARWMTEEELLGGTDFEHAFGLKLDTPATAIIDTKGEKVYFTFTITESGTYYLYSTSDTKIDTLVILYNANQENIGSADGYWDYSEWDNFGMKKDLEAGTYYIAVYLYEYASYSSGTFEVHLSQTSPK